MKIHLGVSKNRATPKSSHFNRVFHYKPSHFGVPLFLETPISTDWGSVRFLDLGGIDTLTFFGGRKVIWKNGGKRLTLRKTSSEFTPEMDGCNHEFPFGACPAYFQGQSVSFREGRLIICIYIYVHILYVYIYIYIHV